MYVFILYQKATLTLAKQQFTHWYGVYSPKINLTGFLRRSLLAPLYVALWYLRNVQGGCLRNCPVLTLPGLTIEPRAKLSFLPGDICSRSDNGRVRLRSDARAHGETSRKASLEQRGVVSRALSRACVLVRRSGSFSKAGHRRRFAGQSGPIRWSDREPGGRPVTGGHQRGRVQQIAPRLVWYEFNAPGGTRVCVRARERDSGQLPHVRYRCRCLDACRAKVSLNI